MTATPPPELVEQWGEDWYRSKVKHTDLQSYIVAKAVQWGADTELEACCEWLDVPNNRSDRGDGWLMPGRLRAARRPKPASLAETATYELDEAVMRGDCISTTDAMPHLRAALKRLAELENQPQS